MWTDFGLIDGWSWSDGGGSAVWYCFRWCSNNMQSGKKFLVFYEALHMLTSNRCLSAFRWPWKLSYFCPVYWYCLILLATLLLLVLENSGAFSNGLQIWDILSLHVNIWTKWIWRKAGQKIAVFQLTIDINWSNNRMLWSYIWSYIVFSTITQIHPCLSLKGPINF